MSEVRKVTLSDASQPQDSVSDHRERVFGRLLQNSFAAASSDRPSFEQLQTDVLAAPPVESAKTFVGPNGTYYDDRWRWMDWRGRARSWNWAAAVSVGGWLAYRRMYGYAALYLGWFAAMVALLYAGVSALVPLLALLLVSLGLGLYGNTLYLRRFRQVALAAAKTGQSYSERVAAVARAGGVDQRALYGFIAAQLVILIGLIGVFRYFNQAIRLVL